jgi:ABC-type Fe3+-hydroxamate transport system substrate-binding protein
MTQATVMRILPDLQQEAKATLESIQDEIAKLRAENATLKAKDKGVSLKVTDKGGLSMYGLGRFPVTLYKSQWLKLLAQAEVIKAFIDEAGDKLTSKD